MRINSTLPPATPAAAPRGARPAEGAKDFADLLAKADPKAAPERPECRAPADRERPERPEGADRGRHVGRDKHADRRRGPGVDPQPDRGRDAEHGHKVAGEPAAPEQAQATETKQSAAVPVADAHTPAASALVPAVPAVAEPVPAAPAPAPTAAETAVPQTAGERHSAEHVPVSEPALPGLPATAPASTEAEVAATPAPAAQIATPAAGAAAPVSVDPQAATGTQTAVATVAQGERDGADAAATPAEPRVAGHEHPPAQSRPADGRPATGGDAQPEQQPGSGPGSRDTAASARKEEPAAPAIAPRGEPQVPLQVAARPEPGAGAPQTLQRAVPLERAPRAVEQLIHIASQRGISHARLALRPAELGGLEITLQTSGAGVTAQVIAESPEAARLLQQSVEDLRRALARQDVTLVSLEVSTSQRDASSEAGDAGAGFSERAQGRSGDHGRRRPADDAEATEAPVVQTIHLPDGVLVDVLA